MKPSLIELTRYCDRLLRVSGMKDYDGAVNGLQAQNNGRVTRLACAVDASLATIRQAIQHRADLLLVHHGLFWTPRHPWTGPNHTLLALLLQNNLAVYSSHLPLDMHPRLGNNAVLASALGFAPRRTRPFFQVREQFVGVQVRASLTRDALAAKLQQAVGTTPLVIPGGPQRCQRIGIVTGGAGSELKIAAKEGVDTFITGEGPHWTYALAEELGVNVFYAGHYATETFGVKALARHLSLKFKLPWTFLDHPTGL